MEISNRSTTQKLQRNELDLFVGISNVRHLQQKSRTKVIKFILREQHADDGILPGGLCRQSNAYGI